MAVSEDWSASKSVTELNDTSRYDSTADKRIEEELLHIDEELRWGD